MSSPATFTMLNFVSPRIPCKTENPYNGTLELPVTNYKNSAFSVEFKE